MMTAKKVTTCDSMTVISELPMHLILKHIETSQNQGRPLSKNNVLSEGTSVVTPGGVAVKMRVRTSEKPRKSVRALQNMPNII